MIKIVSKDFCTFTGVYTAIYVGPCCRSYVLFARKRRISEMLGKLSPTFKLYDIKFSHYPDGRYTFFTCTRARLSAIPIKPVFLYLQIFYLNYYDWILSIGEHVNFADLSVSLRLPTFCIVFPTFLRTGIFPYFTWSFIDWFSAGFFSQCIFSMAEEKKTGKKACKKYSSKLSQKYTSVYSFKRKCNFFYLNNSFGKATWFV